jgi:hypothetical protein
VIDQTEKPNTTTLKFIFSNVSRSYAIWNVYEMIVVLKPTFSFPGLKSALKMEAVCFSETLLSHVHTALQPRHLYRRENLIPASHIR